MDASILIPVKDAEDFISESLQSCLNQVTEYSFEIILVDDYCIDKTLEIANLVAKKANSLIRIIPNQGSGISEALNTGLHAAIGEFILRHDADDKMLPGRIQTQITYARANPKLTLLGGQISFIGAFNTHLRPNIYPTEDFELRKMLSRGCFFAHPTVLFRRADAIDIGGYNKHVDGAEDYELWLLLARLGQIRNLGEVLTEYRLHPLQVTVNKRKKSLISTTRVRLCFIFNLGRFLSIKNSNMPEISKFQMFFHLLIEIKDHFVAFIKKSHR